MANSAESSGASQLERRLRLLAILRGSDRAGISPLALSYLHTVAYFADALAPVWGLRILDAQKLKRSGAPMSPVLQRDLDRLVGIGVVTATNVEHVRDDEERWALQADYSLNALLAYPIVEAALSFEWQADHFGFVEEIVFAVSALGASGIQTATGSDAAYGDPMVDIGGLLDLRPWPEDRTNRAVRFAKRFGTLLGEDITLTSGELIHMYVRHLYQQVQDVA